jgi:hypothetical protein
MIARDKKKMGHVITVKIEKKILGSNNTLLLPNG